MTSEVPALNLGILAHVDAGKTSLTERLLYEFGATNGMGSVDGGTTQTDSGELERLRGITIRASVASFTVADLQVNLVDTPGHPDFIAEVERSLSVLDAAILVVSAVEGVQAQSHVLMRSLRKLGLPTLIFVNKIDRRGARTADLIAEIRARLAPSAVVMSTVTRAGTAAAAAEARSLEHEGVRTEIAEILAEHDDELLWLALENRIPDSTNVLVRLAEQFSSSLLNPIYFGSAHTGSGCRNIVHGVRELLAKRSTESVTEDGPSGVVFAVGRSASGEKTALLRLFSGELRPREKVIFHHDGYGERPGQYQAQLTGVEVVGTGSNRLTAGGIGRIRGARQARVGDRIGPPRRSGAVFPPPAFEVVVRSAKPDDATKLHAALLRLADEDPLIKANPLGDGATSVFLYGEVQKEVIEARLRDEFAVHAVFEEVQPLYYERLLGTGEAQHEIKPHRANRFWATVGLRVEPDVPGTGHSYRGEVEIGSIPRAFHTAIEETVARCLRRGPLGWQMVDCAVTLTKSGYSAPNSVAADFRAVTPLVLAKALQVARTEVHEPCLRFQADVPSDLINVVTNRLIGFGADIGSTVESASGTWLISGEIPARLAQSFAATLPGITRGEGFWWTEPGRDRPVRLRDQRR